jgi:hypothetical protein
MSLQKKNLERAAEISAEIDDALNTRDQDIGDLVFSLQELAAEQRKLFEDIGLLTQKNDKQN